MKKHYYAEYNAYGIYVSYDSFDRTYGELRESRKIRRLYSPRPCHYRRRHLHKPS